MWMLAAINRCPPVTLAILAAITASVSVDVGKMIGFGLVLGNWWVL